MARLVVLVPMHSMAVFTANFLVALERWSDVDDQYFCSVVQWWLWLIV
jgi:hypothetical protein